MATKIQVKRGLSQNFNSINLSIGEPAFVTDLGKFYVGDGTNNVLINPIDKPAGINTTDYFTKLKVNEYGQVVETTTLLENDIPNLSYTKITGLGTVATLNVGTSSGNVPVLNVNGKLETAVLPQLAITNTFVANSQEAMLSLDAQVGDIAVRTDVNESYILQKEPASELDSWVKLLTPTDSVLSVNGKTGAVNLIGSDINLTGYTKPSDYSSITGTDNTSLAIGKLEANFSNYAPLASPSLTGNPTAPTAAIGNNSTLIATTEFVQTALSTIDGGTF